MFFSDSLWGSSVNLACEMAGFQVRKDFNDIYWGLGYNVDSLPLIRRADAKVSAYKIGGSSGISS